MNAASSEGASPDVLTRAEVADLLRVPVATTYRLSGIPCRRVGREFRFSRAAVMRWLEGDDHAAAAGEHDGLPVAASRSKSGGRGQVFSMPHRGGVAG